MSETERRDRYQRQYAHHDETETTESGPALEERLARAGLVERGAGSPVRGESAQPSVYTAGGVRPDPYGQPSSVRTIDGEEARLIAGAKQDGFFWGTDKLPAILQAIGRKRAGGNEHDVYIVGTSPNRVVIRSTVKDSYGFPFASPAQYLQRMADYNATFPHLAIEILGVSRAPVLGKLSDEHGNGVIWTAQPFVEGREFADQGDLNAAMQANGWDRVSELEFRHRETGTVIGDAHTGNVLQTRDGKLAPIDVIVRRLPEGVDGTGDVGAGGAAGGRGAAVPADVGRLGKARGALDAQPGP